MSKTFHRSKRFGDTEIFDNVDRFLEDIIEVYKKHGLSIGHEDEHGAFIVESYSDYNITWLNDAMYRTTT